MALLGCHQSVEKGLGGWAALEVCEEEGHPLAPSGKPQVVAIAGPIPAPGQTGLGKGLVVGHAMALEFRLSEGAIHIPKNRLKGRSHCTNGPITTG